MPFNETLNPYVLKVRHHTGVSTEVSDVFSNVQGHHAIVDLGCGNGHFLRDYLAQNPEFKGVGVERRFKRIYKTAEKLEGLTGHVIQYDVLEFLDESPARLWDEVWLQFPDPWPKLRHEKNRMVTPDFLNQVHRVLKPGGCFRFRSDCFYYWEFLQMENLRQNLFPIQKSMKGDLFGDTPTTLYQRKFFQRSIPVYSLEFRVLQ